MTKKFAIVLSGCGFLDGAEIREAVLTLLHFDAMGMEYDIFAPDAMQMHAVNHLTQTEIENRNILEESARIARGNIKPLTDLDPKNYAGIFLPGGFGVAKNLSNFATHGADAEAFHGMNKILQDFHSQKKPIGAVCIAPALVALALGHKGVTVTIGNDEGTASAIESFGAKHSSQDVENACFDEENLIATAPAYMYGDAKMHLVSKGIKEAVDKVISWS